MNTKYIILTEISHLCEKLRIGEIIETESRLEVSRTGMGVKNKEFLIGIEFCLEKNSHNRLC